MFPSASHFIWIFETIFYILGFLSLGSQTDTGHIDLGGEFHRGDGVDGENPVGFAARGFVAQAPKGGLRD
jgi:hypothetical protein